MSVLRTLLILLIAGAAGAESFNPYERLKRLRQHFERFSHLAPHPVTGVLASFDRPLSLPVDCPAIFLPKGAESGLNGGAAALPAQRFSLQIVTRPEIWDPRALKRADSNGRYEWSIHERYSPEGRRTAYAANRISIDSEADGLDSPDSSKKIAGIVLFYHELLHGQLLIDRIPDPRWQKLFCDYFRSPEKHRQMMAPSLDHKTIIRLENKFKERVTDAVDTMLDDGWHPDDVWEKP